MTVKFFEPFFDLLEWPSNLRVFIASELQSRKGGWHGVGHHALLLRELQQTFCEYSKELYATAFFHDIVYDPTRSDNERMSAATARLWLPTRSDFDNDFVIETILATEEHRLVTTHTTREQAIRIFLLADMSILWTQNPSQYGFYARGVRHEYRHVPNDLYRAGRAKVLNQLRGQIHPFVGAETSMNMSINIERELIELEEGLYDL